MERTFSERVLRAKSLLHAEPMRALLDCVTVHPTERTLSMVGHHHRFDAVEFAHTALPWRADGYGFRNIPKSFRLGHLTHRIGRVALFPLTELTVVIIAEITQPPDYRTFFLVWDIRGELWVAKGTGEIGQKLEHVVLLRNLPPMHHGAPIPHTERPVPERTR